MGQKGDRSVSGTLKAALWGAPPPEWAVSPEAEKSQLGGRVPSQCPAGSCPGQCAPFYAFKELNPGGPEGEFRESWKKHKAALRLRGTPGTREVVSGWVEMLVWEPMDTHGGAPLLSVWRW